MRRTAALLLLPLFLAVALGEYEASSEGWQSRVTREKVDASSILSQHALDLLPMLLIAAACTGRTNPFLPVLQTVGSLWLLALWARIPLLTPFPEILIFHAIPFLGMTLVSLRESIVFHRRPPSPDPEFRFVISVLVTLAVWEAGKTLGGGRYLTSTWDGLLWIANHAGTCGVLLLTAWGLCRRTRWALWLGCIACTWFSGVTLWQFGSDVVQRPVARDSIVWFHLISQLPAQLLQTAAAVLLGLRIRRDWKAASTPAGPEERTMAP